jgi:hypothetical protein
MEPVTKIADRSAPKVGSITFQLHGDVLELTWSGFISEETVGGSPREMKSFLGSVQPAYAIFDATAVTSYSGDSRVPGGAILTELRRRGVKKTIVVTNSGAIRMIGSAVAVAVGLQLRFVETRVEAANAIVQARLGIR